MAYCTSCGAPLEGPFCTHCGTNNEQPAPAGPEASNAGPPPPGQSPPRKSKALVYVLAGCGGLVVLAAVILIASGVFIRRHLGDAGNNPVMAAARMVAAMNPDIEVVSADEDSGRITLRERKTGKTITMDFRDIQKGRITFEGDKGEQVEIEGGGGPSGVLRVETPEGTVQAGQTSLAHVPDWAPRCPGGEPTGAVSAEGAGADKGVFQLRCRGSVEEVTDFYEGALKKQGMTVRRQALMSGATEMALVEGKDDASGRSVTATVLSSDQGPTAQVVYQSKR